MYRWKLFLTIGALDAISVGRPKSEWILEQNQNARFGIVINARQGIIVKPQYRLNLTRGAIPAPNPDHFGRSAKHGAQITEVSVLAYDDVAAGASGVPDRQVRGTVKPDAVNVH